jgi:hypothetical protein
MLSASSGEMHNNMMLYILHIAFIIARYLTRFLLIPEDPLKHYLL